MWARLAEGKGFILNSISHLFTLLETRWKPYISIARPEVSESGSFINHPNTLILSYLTLLAIAHIPALPLRITLYYPKFPR